MPKVRRAVLLITPELLVDMCKPGLRPAYEVVDHALPVDTWVVSGQWRRDMWCIGLVLESIEFAEVPEGAVLPVLLNPVFRRLPPVGVEQ